MGTRHKYNPVALKNISKDKVANSVFDATLIHIWYVAYMDI